MLADFHFLRPGWLWLLPVVLVVTLALARRRLPPGSWQRVVDPALVPYVLSRGPTRQGAWRWWLLGAAGVLAVLALAGPAWERIEQPVYRSEEALVVALDLSRSMDAQDLTPSRLTRARLKILDILERRRSGQTALVVYSSNAFTVTPLTTDTDTVAALVNSLSTDIMPSRGSYPPAAIRKARALLEQAGVADGSVLLITDGGSSPAARAAARELVDAGYTLSVLGVGTAQGAPIPRPGGGFVTGRSGDLAVPRLEEQGLRELAAEGRGVFALMSPDNADIDRLLGGPEAAGTRAADESQATDQWREAGVWLLVALVPLASLAFRRGWVLAAAFALLPLPEDAQAFGWSDLWRTRDQQAAATLADGDAAGAAALFEDPRWRAVAQYRAGDYGLSAEAFAGRGGADAIYNRGNALARMGQYEAAIEAYERALERNPDDADAAYNRDLLRELLAARDAQNDSRSQQQAGEPGGDAERSDGESRSEAAGQAGNQGAAGDEARERGAPRDEQQADEEGMRALQQELERAAREAAEQGAESEQQQGRNRAETLARRRQEQQQAMEQWLRRIPDDPGGLLRRKFRYQYQRQGRDQDGNNLWPDDEVQPW